MSEPVDDQDDGPELPIRRPSPTPRPSPEAESAATSDAVPAESVGPVSAQKDAPQVALAADAAASRPWWRGRSRGPEKKSLVREVPVLVLIALVLALLIKSFVVQPFYIPSGSMERTLLINDRVLVNKMIYHFRDVKRGEIVVFNIDGTGFERYAAPLTPPSNIVSRAFRNLENLFGLGPNNKDFIKRVIAIGGDTVACCNAKGQVTVNGVGLDEPYVFRDMGDESNKRFGPVKINPGHLWVMGDHRDNSEDSRVGGQVPQSAVVGQAFVRVWPINKWRGFGVPSTFSSLSASAPSGVGMVVPILFWRRRSKKGGKKRPVFPALDSSRAPPTD